MSTDKVQFGEEEHRRQLKELAAKPYRGACQLCPYSLWFFDSEVEAVAKMTEHLDQEHPHIVYWHRTA